MIILSVCPIIQKFGQFGHIPYCCLLARTWLEIPGGGQTAAVLLLAVDDLVSLAVGLVLPPVFLLTLLPCEGMS